jgi:hypothetical protein
MDLTKLADERALLSHLPKATLEKSTWQQFHQSPISHCATID